MAEQNEFYELCPQCNGTGKLSTITWTEGGNVTSESVCPRCDGNKTVLSGYCPAGIFSVPLGGSFKVKNFYVNTDNKLVVEYDDQPAE